METAVAIPLGQGQVFNVEKTVYPVTVVSSQSLWVRDRFLIIQQREVDGIAWVAIPLGQGQVFNHTAT